MQESIDPRLSSLREVLEEHRKVFINWRYLHEMPREQPSPGVSKIISRNYSSVMAIHTAYPRRKISMRKNFLGVLLLSAISLGACSVEPDAPKEKPLSERPATDLSTLEVAVNLPYAVIEQEISKAIPNELHQIKGQPIKNCPVDECSFEARFLRNGDVSVKHDGSGRVVVNLPIHIVGRADIMKRVFISRMRKHQDFSASVTAIVTLGFALQPDWSIAPTAEIAFHVHRAEAHLDLSIATIGISFRGEVAKALNKKRDYFQRKIVEAIKGSLDFRPDVANAWNQLHSSHRISNRPSVWLVADPVSFQAANLIAEDAGLRVVAGIDAYLRARIQQERPDPPRPEALPDLNIVQDMSGHYKLSLPVSISVDEANRQINGLLGTEYLFEAVGKKISAELIGGHAYVNGPDLVVYVKVRANKAVFGLFPITVGAYLNGTPAYDAASATVFLDRFDYDADTNNLLLDQAEWFLRDAIRESLKTALRFDITEELDRAHQLMAENLDAMRLNEHVTLYGTVDEFSPRAVYTAEKTINVDMLAEGRLKVELNP